MSLQHAGVSRGRTRSVNRSCCHTETEDQTWHFPKSQYIDTGPTAPNAGPKMPGAWQGSHWSVNFRSLVWFNPEKSPRRKRKNPRGANGKIPAAQTGIELLICSSWGGYLTTRPTRRFDRALEEMWEFVDTHQRWTSERISPFNWELAPITGERQNDDHISAETDTHSRPSSETNRLLADDFGRTLQSLVS